MPPKRSCAKSEGLQIHVEILSIFYKIYSTTTGQLITRSNAVNYLPGKCKATPWKAWSVSAFSGFFYLWMQTMRDWKTWVAAASAASSEIWRPGQQVVVLSGHIVGQANRPASLQRVEV